MLIEILTAAEAVKKYHWHELKGRPVIAAHLITEHGFEMVRGVITGLGESGSGLPILFAFVCDATGEVIEIGIFNDEEFTLFDHSLKPVLLNEQQQKVLPC